LQQLRLDLGGSLQFDVNQLAACGSGFVKDIDLRGDRTAKLSPACGSPASSDRDRAVVGFEKALDSRER
jgi:hypothetical protein